MGVLQTRGEYSEVFVRITGMLMSELGITVVGMILNNTRELYPATFFIRAYFLAGFVALYFMTKDPLFIVLFTIVLLGFILTLSAFLIEHVHNKF